MTKSPEGMRKVEEEEELEGRRVGKEGGGGRRRKVAATVVVEKIRWREVSNEGSEMKRSVK